MSTAPAQPTQPRPPGTAARADSTAAGQASDLPAASAAVGARATSRGRWLWLGLRRVLDYAPPTPRALLIALASGAAVYGYGMYRLDLVALVIGATGLGLTVLSWALVGVAGLWVRVGVRRTQRLALQASDAASSTAPMRLEAGATTPNDFSLPTLRFLPWLRLRWSWLEPVDVEVSLEARGGRAQERIRPNRRAKVDTITRQVVVEDSFGLGRISFPVRQLRPVTILPDRGRLTDVNLVRGLGGGDDRPHPRGLPEGDRVDSRKYAPGDPIRNILWKTFARTRVLMVRTPERALAPARRTVAYLIAAEHDEAPAAAARVALETGAFGPSWLFAADGSTERTSDVSKALELVAASAHAGAAGKGQGQALGSYLDEAERGGDARCVVFVPPRPGPWLAAVTSAARRRRGRMTAVVVTDGVDREPARPRWQQWARRLLWRQQPTLATPAALLDQVVREIWAAGVEPTTLDRRTGKNYGRTHKNPKQRKQASGALSATPLAKTSTA